MGIRIRPAEQDDYDDVASFTSDTWPDRDEADYLPRVYRDWIRGDDRRTLVAERDGDAVGIAQCVLLSECEAWCQGLRVAPEARGEGLGERLLSELLEWAREEGAAVARCLVYSWNGAGMGQVRSVGFRPATSFRWLRPEPADEPAPADGYDDLDRSGRQQDRKVGGPDDPDAAWSWWLDSDVRGHLGGLALSETESWALQELTREDLRRAAADGRLFVVGGRTGVEGFAFRSRTTEELSGEGTLAEYGVCAWTDRDAAGAVIDAIAADAASVGASRVRAPVPEAVGYVSDAATWRVALSDVPEYVFVADLTADGS